METVETGIAEADMTNLMLTNRITTFLKFKIQNCIQSNEKCRSTVFNKQCTCLIRILRAI